MRGGTEQIGEQGPVSHTSANWSICCMEQSC